MLASPIGKIDPIGVIYWTHDRQIADSLFDQPSLRGARSNRSHRGSHSLVEGTSSMLRRSFVFGALLAITLTAANGCQSCSSCHDYDPPVANCHCGSCSQCGCNG